MPEAQTTERAQTVEQHARSHFGALARRDVEALAEHWNEDGVVDLVPLGVLRGRDEICAFFRELFAAFPDLETTVSQVVVGERQAAVEWRMSGHFTGSPFQGVDATGRAVELRGMDLMEVEDGRTSAVTAYYDGMSFARQVGLLPPQDSTAERAMKSAFNGATRLRRALAERRAES